MRTVGVIAALVTLVVAVRFPDQGLALLISIVAGLVVVEIERRYR